MGNVISLRRTSQCLLLKNNLPKTVDTTIFKHILHLIPMNQLSVRKSKVLSLFDHLQYLFMHFPPLTTFFYSGENNGQTHESGLLRREPLYANLMDDKAHFFLRNDRNMLKTEHHTLFLHHSTLSTEYNGNSLPVLWSYISCSPSLSQSCHQLVLGSLHPDHTKDSQMLCYNVSPIVISFHEPLTMTLYIFHLPKLA